MNVWAISSVAFILISYVIYYCITKAGKKLYTLYSLFCFMWLAIIILSSLRLFGLYETSSRFYLLLCMGIVFWILGYFVLRYSKVNSWNFNFFFNNHKGKKENKSITGQIENHEINVKFFIAFETIILVFTIAILLRTITLMREGYSLEEVHDLFLNRGEEDFFSSSTINTIYSKVMVPCLYAIIPVSVLMLFEHTHLILSFSSLVLVLVYCFVSGGRFAILYLIIDLILCLGLYNIALSKKAKRRFALAVLFGLFSIIGITIIRRKLYITGNYADMFDSYYTYITLCMPLGDYWIDYIDKNNYITYGFATFKGVLSNIDYIMSKVGLGAFSSVLAKVSDIVFLTDENYIRIATGHQANAYVTWIYYFYLDLREFGVMIGSFLFGGLTGFFEKYSIRKRTLITNAYYLLFAQCVVKSFVRWELGVAAYILAFVYIRALLKKA